MVGFCFTVMMSKRQQFKDLLTSDFMTTVDYFVKLLFITDFHFLYIIAHHQPINTPKLFIETFFFTLLYTSDADV